MKKRLESGIYGKGIGDNYKSWVGRLALNHNLNGVIFRKGDGTLKIVVEGDESDLNQFKSKLTKGSTFSFIEHFYTKWYDVSNEFTSFSILD